MNISMRDAFLNELYDIARADRNVMLISNDFGAPSLDKFRTDLPDQFIHIGIAEQNMVNVATGLVLADKIVYMYSIIPFLPLRCFEQVRLHMAFRQNRITGVGVGAGYSYDLSGPTHHGLEDVAAMNALPGMTIYNASDSVIAAKLARLTYENSGPKYVRFDREIFSPIYDWTRHNVSDGLVNIAEGQDVTIVSTGAMTHQALQVRDRLAERSISAGVVDLYRVKPLNTDLMMKSIEKTGKIVSIEENFLTGGIGSILSTLITDSGKDLKLKRFGIPDRYFTRGGGKEELLRLCGLDTDTVTEKILRWIK